jgi:Family of unknown function (DUF6200)
MAHAATSTTESKESREHDKESREHDKGGSTSMVIVELDEPQSTTAVRRLRKGKGRLFHRVDRIIRDLAEDGTIKASAQPIVIVVQEIPALPWAVDEDDDD